MSIEKPSTPPPVEDPDATKKPPRPLTPEERAEENVRMEEMARARLASELARIEERKTIDEAIKEAEDALNKARVPYNPPSKLGFDTSALFQNSPPTERPPASAAEPESSEQSS